MAGVVCRGGFQVGEAGACGICGRFWLSAVFWGVCFCRPLVYGFLFFSLVVQPWACVGSPESRLYPP